MKHGIRTKNLPHTNKNHSSSGYLAVIDKESFAKKQKRKAKETLQIRISFIDQDSSQNRISNTDPVRDVSVVQADMLQGYKKYLVLSSKYKIIPTFHLVNLQEDF
jgi:hypothetical protein